MAPVVASLLTSLAILSLAEASPLSPGRHARPDVANLLSTSKRGLHTLLSRYYGTAHGLVSHLPHPVFVFQARCLVSGVPTNLRQTRPPALQNKRDASIPAGWTSVGCVDESWDERLLQGTSFSSSSMTPTLCLTQCQKLGFTYGGTEFGDEVGPSIRSEAQKVILMTM